MLSGELYLRRQGCRSVADSLPAFDANPALWVVEEEVCLSISISTCCFMHFIPKENKMVAVKQSDGNSMVLYARYCICMKTPHSVSQNMVIPWYLLGKWHLNAKWVVDLKYFWTPYKNTFLNQYSVTTQN